jgi:hypothetical protein
LEREKEMEGEEKWEMRSRRQIQFEGKKSGRGKRLDDAPTNTGQTNPGHGKPWTGQTLDMKNPGHDKSWTGQTLDTTYPGHDKPLIKQTLEMTNPG